MNDFDPTLVLGLDRLAPAAAVPPDWNDVLARSGHARRTPRALAIAVVAAGAVVLAAPAIGISDKVGDLLGIRSGPRPGFVAALVPVAGSGSGTVIAAPATTFTPVGSRRTVGFPPRLAVTIRFAGLSGPATAGRIRVAPRRGSSDTGYVIRLCGPCHSGTTVTIHRSGLFLALMSGRGIAEIATAAHPTGELRGTLVTTRSLPRTP